MKERTEVAIYGAAPAFCHEKRLKHTHARLALDCRDKPGNDDYIIISNSYK